MTRRERFLSEIDLFIPWQPILALIQPHYVKAGNDTQPMPLERHGLSERLFGLARGLLE